MIKSLTCQAYGQHQDKKIDFHPGLTVLLGANEAGKSTIKNALFDVFYGFSPANMHDHPYVSWDTGNIILKGECHHGDVFRRLDERGPRAEWVHEHEKITLKNQEMPGFSSISRSGFKEIYNIDLYDLSLISDKTWREVEGMWVSQSNYYHLKSSRDVDKEWKDQIDSLWRPRKKTGVLIKQLEHDKQVLEKEKVLMDQALKERESLTESLKKNLLVKTDLENKLSTYQAYREWLDQHQEQDYRYQQYLRYVELGDPLPKCFQAGKLSEFKAAMVEDKMYKEHLLQASHRYEGLMLQVKPLSKEDQSLYAKRESIRAAYEESKKAYDEYLRYQVMYSEKEVQYQALLQESGGSKGKDVLSYGFLGLGLAMALIGWIMEQELLGFGLGMTMMLGAFFFRRQGGVTSISHLEQVKRECDILKDRLDQGKPEVANGMDDVKRIEAIIHDNRSIQSQVMEAQNQVEHYEKKIKQMKLSLKEELKTLKLLGKNDIEQGLIIVDKLYEESVQYHHAMEQYKQLDQDMKKKLQEANDYIKHEMDQHQEAIEQLAMIHEEEEKWRTALETLPTFEEGEKLLASFSKVNDDIKLAYRKLDSLMMLRELLAASDETFKRVYQPIIMERVSYYMAKFTNHKYHRFIRDEEGELSVEIEGHFRQVDTSLSQGMRDLLYLSLKLAVIDALGEASIPLVLDEVWVNLDRIHRERLLEVLAEEAKERQIIMMTCHPDWVEGLGEKIHIVNM